MRGVYTASASFSIASAKTLMYLTLPATCCVEILSASVSNEDNETNEQIDVALERITTIGTPTATAVTPEKHEVSDAASTVTVGSNATVEPTTYGTTIFRAGAASLNGWRFEPVPEERPVIPPSASWGLRLKSAVTAFTGVVRITYREIG